MAKAKATRDASGDGAKKVAKQTPELVLPAVTEGIRLRHWVTPQDRHEHCAKLREKYRPAADEPAPARARDQVIHGSFNEGQAGPTSLDSPYWVYVKELRYPGHADEVNPIAGKWVYAFHKNKLVSWARVDAGGRWTQYDAGEKQIGTSDNQFHLDPGPASDRSYTFFLSPVKLGRAAIEELTRGDTLSWAAVTVCCNGEGKNVYVYISDPWSWAAALHAHYYLPLLRQWKEWATDPERQCKKFIAEVLDGWIRNGDKHDIEGLLWKRFPPKKLLEKHRKDEAALREAAEEAGMQLAQAVDCPEHRCVELAALAAGKQALSSACQALACVTEGLCETRTGQRLAMLLANDRARIPARLIFRDTATPGLEFGEYRYAYLGIMALARDLAPAACNIFHRKRFQAFIEHLGVKTAAEAYAIAGSELLWRMERLAPEVKLKYKNETIVSYDRLRELGAAWADSFNPRAENIKPRARANKIDQIYQPLMPYLEGIQVTAGAVIEVFNFCAAYSALLEASEQDSADKALELVGASADLATMLFDRAEGLAASRHGLRYIKGFGGAASFVSGIIDMMGFQQQAQSAWLKHDYGRACGMGVAAVGAATGAFAGAMVTASAVLKAGSALGPVGAVAGIVGAVLVGVGSYVAVKYASTPFKDFAARCFMGHEHNHKSEHRWWARHNIPCKSVAQEAEVLTALISNFAVTGSVGHVEIHPGLIHSESSFEAIVQTVCGGQREEYRVEINIEDEKVRHVSGAQPGLCSVDRARNGRVKGIYLGAPLPPAAAISPAEPTRDEGGGYSDRQQDSGGDQVNAWVRLRLGDSPYIRTPMRECWLVCTFDVGKSQRYSSLMDQRIANGASFGTEYGKQDLPRPKELK